MFFKIQDDWYCLQPYCWLIGLNIISVQNLLNQGFQGRRQKMTLKMIQEKAKKKEYNTIEGLLGDLKSILYEAVQYQGGMQYNFL